MAALKPAQALRHKYGPGLLLVATIATASGFLSEHYGGPVMLFALLIGMAFNFLAEEKRCADGIGFASKNLLRIGIALLGMRITFGDMTALGFETVFAVCGLLALTIASGFLAIRLFGGDWKIGLLTGGAVAICGASAALALAAVIPPDDKSERNTLFTVVAVTTLSTLAMIIYPILFASLNMSDAQSGFLIGATIHDVAQVAGAGYSISDSAGETATVVKLMRVTLLPVVVLVVLLGLGRTNGDPAGVFPKFVLAFLALAAIHSFGILPEFVVTQINEVSRWLLVAAIAAIGVKTNLGAITEVGGGLAAIVIFETLILLAAAVALVMSGVLPFS